MARRKVEQQALFKQRGGERRGAGRKPKGARAGGSHKKRPELKARNPVHVVLRVVRDVGNLRRRETYHAIRKATEVVAGRDEFRIVHVSIQANHIHLMIEATDQRALSRNMKGFQVSAARNINAVIQVGDGPRRGPVFPDRFHASIITTPKQARHTLAYLLLNWRRHGEDRTDVGRGWTIDWYSSAASFTGWVEYYEADFPRQGPPGHIPLRVAAPQSWLLREGWKRSGVPISCYSTPEKR